MGDKKSIGDWSGDVTLGGGLHQIGFATWLKRSLCYAPSDGAASGFFFGKDRVVVQRIVWNLAESVQKILDKSNYA